MKSISAPVSIWPISTLAFKKKIINFKFLSNQDGADDSYLAKLSYLLVCLALSRKLFFKNNHSNLTNKKKKIMKTFTVCKVSNKPMIGWRRKVLNVVLSDVYV